MWIRKHTLSVDENPRRSDATLASYYDIKELDIVPKSFTEEEILRMITDSDLQVMNKKIKTMYNKQEAIIRSLEGKAVNVTALNIDIVNSTAQVRKLSNDEAGLYYQTFIESTSDLIMKNGGYVLKNVGDCVLGFFPCGKHFTENHEKAIFCGLDIFDMLRDSLNPYLASKNIPTIQCRIAADFGATKMIRIASRQGYSEVDLFGSAMNSAAKILHYAKPGQMVIGDDLFWQLDDYDDLEFKILKRWDVTAKHTYQVYSVERKLCKVRQNIERIDRVETSFSVLHDLLQFVSTKFLNPHL
jgi:class 3 adenylate cyclase